MINKQKFKDFLTDERDIRFEDIVDELNISKEKYSNVNKILDELIDERWIRKSKCLDGEFEYDPGEMQGF